MKESLDILLSQIDTEIIEKTEPTEIANVNSSFIEDVNV